MRLKFSDLFEGLSTDELRYSERCKALCGREVELKGYLSRAHPQTDRTMLVAEPGVCPDCSPVPVACLALPGFSAATVAAAAGASAVRLRGRLSYGLERDAEGNASYLRLEQARVATGISS
jgi:hypothetical protein